MVNSVYNNHPNYHTDAFGSKAETCQIAMDGLTQPTPAGLLFCYEKRSQKRIKEEVSSLKFSLGAR